MVKQPPSWRNTNTAAHGYPAKIALAGRVMRNQLTPEPFGEDRPVETVQKREGSLSFRCQAVSLRTIALTSWPCREGEVRRGGRRHRWRQEWLPALSCTITRQGGDLPEQSGQVVVEAFPGHETIPERDDDGERKLDTPAGWRVIEKPTMGDAVIPGLGDHEGAILRPVAAFALYFEIERIPQGSIIRFYFAEPPLGLSQRQIFEHAVGMEFRQGLLHAMLVLSRQMPVDDLLKCLVHGAHRNNIH
jgi:hypothetical protein